MSANNVFYKPSFNLSSIFTETLDEENNERFLLFIKGYYEWLQTSEITISNKTGTFVRDEIVTGSTSKASAIVKEVKTSSVVIRMLTNAPLDILETITGGNSGATGTISVIKDNVVRKTGQLLNYRDTTKTVDKYVDFLKQELYQTLPQNIEANKRFVARKYRDFLQNKGNEESYKFLFRSVYNENIEIKYPGEDILRVSDGKFEKTQIIRAVIEDESTIFDYLNQTITGQDSEAIANVVDIKLFNIGSVRVAEMTLKLVSGVFDAGERIEIVGTESTNTAIYGMVTGFTINDAGSGYAVGDTVTITSGEGNEAKAVVSSIQKSPITSIKVNTPGYGYRLNTEATINNSGTGGTGLIVRVTDIANTYSAGGYTIGETATISIISRGSDYFKAPTITLTDSVISSLGLLSENLISIANGGFSYAVGDALVFTGGAGANAAGQVASVNETTTYDLLFEDGFRMKADGSYRDIIKNEDWSVTGSITRLELTNFGTGYTLANLPVITVTSGTGTSANLIATGIQGIGANVSIDVANNATGIGSIRKIDLTDFGVEYVTANVNLASVGDGNANVSAIVTGLGIKEGTWINDDGKVDYKILQDSDYYQDFSYVIRSGLEFNLYSDIVKQAIHPAGLQFFGEILITTKLDVIPVFVDTFKYITNMILKDAALVQASYAALSVENDIALLIQTQTAIYNKIERLVSLQPEIDVSPIISSVIDIISNVNEYIVYLETLINTENLNSFTERQIKINPSLSIYDGFNLLDPNLLTLGETPISLFASNTISTIENFTFEDTYGTGLKTVTKNQKITGTVTVAGSDVIGSGTTLNADFANGDSIIIGNEKFIVNSVANTDYLMLNVSAQGSYTGASAYKETLAI